MPRVKSRESMKFEKYEEKYGKIFCKLVAHAKKEVYTVFIQFIQF